VSSSGIRWVDLLEPHLDKKSEQSSNNVYLCPSDTRPEEKKVVYSTQDVSKLSYGINQCYSKGHESDKPYKLWYGVKINLIRKPSEFICIADAGSYYIGTTISQPVVGVENNEFAITEGFCKKLSFRHTGQDHKFNAVFGDGHVTALKFEATPYRYWDLTNQWDGSF
jgi:prepilin-type processing-associated H-X9-DG protein